MWTSAKLNYFKFLQNHAPALPQRVLFGTLPHPLLKGGYTGHEKTYSGDIDISPGLAETKRNQQILEKSDLPIFLGSSRFFLN